MLKQVTCFAGCTALVALVMSAPIGVAFAQEREATAGGVQLVYAMSSQGYPFGSITLTRRAAEHEGKRVVEEKTVTEMDYTTGSERHTSKSNELAWIGPEGLVKYDATFTENGETTMMKVRWSDDSLLVRSRFAEGDEWAGVEFEKGQFDFTLPENPPLKRVAQAGGKTTLKWLSFYEMAIAPVKIEHLGKERRKAGNTSFDCDIIVFDNPSMGLGGKIWIAQDRMGPFLLREEGRNPDGPFTMQVTEYRAQ